MYTAVIRRATNGIGIKTAALLINEFGSLEELLDRAEEILDE